MSEAPAMICGFGDPAWSFAGLCWRLGGSRGAVVLVDEDGAVVRGEPEDGEIRFGGGEDGTLTVHPVGDAAGLEAPEGERIAEATACGVRGEIEVEGRGRKLEAAGLIVRFDPDPLADSELIRYAAVPLGEDGVLVAVARRPPGVSEHGGEELDAWRLAGPEVERFSESLLSTEYDAEGRPSRIGLELRAAGPEEAAPMRAAGTRAGTVESDGITATLMRTSSEGRTGIGAYVIARR